MSNIDLAIEKLTDEMMKLVEKKDPFAVPLEEHLTSICTNDIVAAKILRTDKSLGGAIRALWSEARKKKQGNAAFMTEQEAYEIVDKYYDISITAPQPVKAAAQKIDVMDLL